MGSMTVHVVDEDQNPVAGTRVFCNFPRSFSAVLPTTSECDTDEDGVEEFEDVPTGAVEIYVEREMKKEIQMYQGEHEDVTITIY
jgi:hypothetical protein